MRHIDLEYQQRCDYIEQSVGRVFDLLQQPAVRQSLGNYALNLCAQAEKLYVPNIHNGIVSAPREYIDTDLVPVVTVKPREKLRVDRTLAGMNAQQTCVADQFLQYWRHTSESGGFPASAEVINNDFVFRHDILNNRFIRGIGAGFYNYVAAGYGFVGREPAQHSKYFMSLPVVVLVENDFNEAEQDIILVHELQHVQQLTHDPVVPAPKQDYQQRMLAGELNAYHISAMLGKILNYTELQIAHGVVYSSGLLSHTYHVEGLRKEFCDPNNPYKINDAGLRESLLKKTAIVIT